MTSIYQDNEGPVALESNLAAGPQRLDSGGTMRTVYKYPFEIQDTVKLALPAAAQILHVETQRGVPCLWALVDTGHVLEERIFYIYGTGHPIERAGLRHVGSFLMASGALVWHVFEGPTP